MKKLLSVLLCVMMVFCMMPTVAFAEEAADLTIGTLEELKAFRDEVNSGNAYKGKIVMLSADIDLTGEEWTPIGNSTNKFQGTFDGNGYTISNLLINGEGKSNMGLFGYTTDGEIKNLTIENAEVSGYLNVGVVAGTPYTSKYSNIKLTGHVEVNGMAYVGGVGGKNAYANWTDITVDVDDTSYVKANSVENGIAYRTYVGGVIGFMGEGTHKVTNVTSNIDVFGSTCDIGGIVGIAHYGNTLEDIVCTGDVHCDAEDEPEVGGIAGVWHNQTGTTVTFEKCVFTGKVYIAGKEVTRPITGGSYNEPTEGSGEVKVTVAKIGDEYYQSFEEAIKATEEMSGDEMLPAAVDVILETGQASVSMLQRRLKLGYARAARIVDEMEERGIVGPFAGSKPRAILVTKEQWESMKSGQSSQMDFSDHEDEPSGLDDDLM